MPVPTTALSISLSGPMPSLEEGPTWHPGNRGAVPLPTGLVSYPLWPLPMHPVTPIPFSPSNPHLPRPPWLYSPAGWLWPRHGPPWAYALCQITQPLRVGSSQGPAPCSVALPHCIFVAVPRHTHVRKLRLGGGSTQFGDPGADPSQVSLPSPRS